MQGDLTTKERVKQWVLGAAQQNSDGSDLLFDGLITGISSFIKNTLDREFGWQEVTEVYDGTSTCMIQLRQAPAYEVASLDLGNGQLVVNQPGQTPNYLLDAPKGPGSRQRLILRGRQFPRGMANIVVTYSYGWKDTMTSSIAAGETKQPLRMFYNDVGVTIAGAAAVKVDSNPGVGQYSVTSAGVYSFNDADAGKQAVITYGYVPDEIELAARQMVGEQYKVKDRIGIVSHGVGGQETTSYSQRDLSQFVKSLLKGFFFVTPR